MTRPSPGEGEFVERLGLFFETLGTTRTMGRIYGWLLICEPSYQSITEIAAALGLSKASISTVVRQLEQAQMVERFPVLGTREHYYHLVSGGWAQVLRGRLGRLQAGTDIFSFGLSVIEPDRRNQREQLKEIRDFFQYVEQELGGEMMRRWDEYRAKRRHD